MPTTLTGISDRNPRTRYPPLSFPGARGIDGGGRLSRGPDCGQPEIDGTPLAYDGQTPLPIPRLIPRPIPRPAQTPPYSLLPASPFRQHIGEGLSTSRRNIWHLWIAGEHLPPAPITHFTRPAHSEVPGLAPCSSTGFERTLRMAACGGSGDRRPYVPSGRPTTISATGRRDWRRAFCKVAHRITCDQHGAVTTSCFQSTVSPRQRGMSHAACERRCPWIFHEDLEPLRKRCLTTEAHAVCHDS
jgi:hypothetical protein